MVALFKIGKAASISLMFNGISNVILRQSFAIAINKTFTTMRGKCDISHAAESCIFLALHLNLNQWCKWTNYFYQYFKFKCDSRIIFEHDQFIISFELPPIATENVNFNWKRRFLENWKNWNYQQDMSWEIMQPTIFENVLWESILFFKISEALEIPLLIQATSNVQKIKEMQYSRTEGDEVEDLFLLLERAKEILWIFIIFKNYRIITDYNFSLTEGQNKAIRNNLSLRAFPLFNLHVFAWNLKKFENFEHFDGESNRSTWYGLAYSSFLIHFHDHEIWRFLSDGGRFPDQFGQQWPWKDFEREINLIVKGINWVSNFRRL